MPLSNGERVPCSLGVLLHALEPALVTDLDLQDVQLPVADRRGDQLVAAALVTVGCEAKTQCLNLPLAQHAVAHPFQLTETDPQVNCACGADTQLRFPGSSKLNNCSSEVIHSRLIAIAPVLVSSSNL